MIDPTTMAAFSDEMLKMANKRAPLSAGTKAALGATGLGGILVGAKGQDYRQDRQEGRMSRLSRQAQQRAAVQSYKNRGRGGQY